MPALPIMNCRFDKRISRPKPVAAHVKPVPIPKLASPPGRNPSTGFLNLYTPDPAPLTYNEKTPGYLYDINFNMPFRILENDYVRLEPLIPSKHLEGFLSLPDESWEVMGDLGPYVRKTALADIEELRQDETCLMLAVIDKQAEAEVLNNDQAIPQTLCPGFAGVYGLWEVNPTELSALFGLINIHPKYRRTHINTHAMYLTLSYLFDDLYLLRVQYDAVLFAESSIRAAKRFGFKEEGVLRNYGGPVPPQKRRKGEEGRKSQDLWLSSMTDEDWEKGGREGMARLASRPVVDTRNIV